MSRDNGRTHYWFVVADESQAHIYKAVARRGPIQLSYSITNDRAREKVEDLIADRGGRSFDSHGQGRHTLQNEKIDPKRQASIVFARRISQMITAASKQGRCKKFALIAAPRFLGLLRNMLPTSEIGEPILTVNKDVVTKPIDEIQALIDSHMPRIVR